jgi:hypothetical protein
VEKFEQYRKNGRWFFQGFVAFTDNSPGTHVQLFTYMYEDGEFRIFNRAGSFEENDKYNHCHRRYKPPRLELLRRRLATFLSRTAVWIAPKAH